MLSTVLIVLLLLSVLGVVPRLPQSRIWNYFPSGGLGLVLLVVVILLLMGGI